MMASSRGRNRSSPRDGSGFGRIGCLLHQAEKHAIMNRAETEDGAYASARNRKLLAGLGLKPGENEYAEPALNPCQTTAYAFFTGDHLGLLLTTRKSLRQAQVFLGHTGPSEIKICDPTRAARPPRSLPPCIRSLDRGVAPVPDPASLGIGALLFQGCC